MRETSAAPALRALTFHERAALLKAVAKRLAELKEEFYSLSFRTGATRNDSAIDIEGGIGTVFAFAGKGSRELPNSRVYLDGAVEGLSKGGTFVGQHIYVSREGAAVHINAFNFPVWGMLEKFAPAILAGVPVIVKPATVTGVPRGTRRAPDRRVRPSARRRAATGVRQSRRLVRAPELPRYGVLHGIGRHRRARCVFIQPSFGTPCASSRNPIR